MSLANEDIYDTGEYDSCGMGRTYKQNDKNAVKQSIHYQVSLGMILDSRNVGFRCSLLNE